MTDAAKKVVSLQLPDHLVRDTDILATHLNISRVALVSQALAAFLASYGYTEYTRPMLHIVLPSRENAEVA